MWPGIAEIGELRVTGPEADAMLLAGWLRSRLERDVTLEHVAAEELESVAVDSAAVELPRGERPDPSDLLSAELDQFGRDRIYEAALRSA